MLVKAKWTVKDASGWHNAGDVFVTEQDMGDAVEVLDAPKQAEPVKAPEPEAKAEEKAAEKPAVKNANRRKTGK